MKTEDGKRAKTKTTQTKMKKKKKIEANLVVFMIDECEFTLKCHFKWNSFFTMRQYKLTIVRSATAYSVEYAWTHEHIL